MKVIISKEILKKFPKLNVGIVVAKDIDNSGSDNKVHHLLEEVEKLIQMNFVPADLAKHPLISPWRTAYSEFGAKPSKYHNSVEALIKSILKGRLIPRINIIVDLYNYLSLKHLVPMGGDDLSGIKGNIKLKIAKGDEKFTQLGKKKIENPEKGEVIYMDDEKVLCRRWNWRECDESKITDKTKDVIIYIEGLFPVKKEKVVEICKELVDLIKSFCSGEAKHYVLNNKNNEVEVS